jgi:hypothetical protein
LTAKAQQRGSATYEEAHCFHISKSAFFKYFLTLDPKASLVSFDTAWEYNINKLNTYAPMYYNTTHNVGVQFDLQNLHSLTSNGMALLKHEMLLEDDKRDKALAHLFATPADQEGAQPAGVKTGILQEMVKRDSAILEKLEGINGAVLALAQSVAETNQLYMTTRRDGLGNQIVSIDPQQLEKLITVAAIPAAEEEPRRLTMAERITKAAVETGTGVLSAIQEGTKISTSQQTAKKIVALFHSKLGHHIPGASTPIGQKAEEIMIPAFVHFAAAAFSDKIPKADFVQRACLRAITGTSKDGTDEMLAVLLPLFQEIISMETVSGFAQQFANESAPALEGQQAPRLEGVDTKALSAALAQQLHELPEDEDFEIVIRRPKTKIEEQPLVPEFQK